MSQLFDHPVITFSELMIMIHVLKIFREHSVGALILGNCVGCEILIKYIHIELVILFLAPTCKLI